MTEQVSDVELLIGMGPVIRGLPPTAGADGSFRLEHRAERCALLVMRPPGPFSRRGLQLEAGKALDLQTITVSSPGAGSGAPRARDDPQRELDGAELA